MKIVEKIPFKILKDVLGSFTVSRLLIAFIGYFSHLIINQGKESNSLINIFFHWDALWYFRLIEYGYYNVPNRLSSVVFFPFYPMMVKLLTFNFFDIKITGYILSNVMLFLAGFYLYKLVLVNFKDEGIASNTVLFMMLAPASFFFSIFYTESVILFLSIACFYYATQKKWLLSSIFGFCFALASSVGVFIVIPMLIEYFDINFHSLKISFKKIKSDIFYLLLVPAGLFSYMAYLYFKYGDALAFVHQALKFGRKMTSVFATLASVVNYTFFYQVLFVGFILFAIWILMYLIYKEVRLSLIVYSGILLFIFLSTNILDSMPRYISIIFPIYLGMGLLASKSNFYKTALVCFSAGLLSLLTLMFANSYWLT